MIKAAIFDMDGLLIDSEPLWHEAFKKAFKTFDIEVTDKDMRAIRGKRQAEAIEQLFRRHDIKNESVAKVQAELINDMKEQIRRNGKLLPGVHHAFEICRQAGLPMAVASSSVSEIVELVMKTLEIGEFFEHIYSAEHEEFGKPHPGTFITTAKLLEVRPESCLVFEDAPGGVLAAKAAKMKCIAVPEVGQRDDPAIRLADVVIDSLEQFDAPMLASLTN
jgi:mannitol-1-/sugar-/sorbitol-6-/2-deoxyglucose-6-phosphatase